MKPDAKAPRKSSPQKTESQAKRVQAGPSSAASQAKPQSSGRNSALGRKKPQVDPNEAEFWDLVDGE